MSRLADRALLPRPPYDQPCSRCGCGLEGQRAQSPNLAWWEHATQDGCIRALVARTGRLEARVEALEAEARRPAIRLDGETRW